MKFDNFEVKYEQQRSDNLKRLKDRCGDAVIAEQKTCDDIATLWVAPDKVHDVLEFSQKSRSTGRTECSMTLRPSMRRMRANRNGQPTSDITVVYQLFSFERNEYIRIKVADK